MLHLVALFVQGDADSFTNFEEPVCFGEATFSFIGI